MDYSKFYLKAKNFDKYQSSMRPGQPFSWIKLHVSILDDEEFNDLSEAVRYQIIALWAYTARLTTRTREDMAYIPANEKRLRRALFLDTLDIGALLESGFYELVDEKGRPAVFNGAGDEKGRPPLAERLGLRDPKAEKASGNEMISLSAINKFDNIKDPDDIHNLSWKQLQSVTLSLEKSVGQKEIAMWRKRFALLQGHDGSSFQIQSMLVTVWKSRQPDAATKGLGKMPNPAAWINKETKTMLEEAKP